MDVAQCPTLGAAPVPWGCLTRMPLCPVLPASAWRPSAPVPFLSFSGDLLATFRPETYFIPLCLCPLHSPQGSYKGSEAGLEVALFHGRLCTPFSEGSQRSILLLLHLPSSWPASSSSCSSQAPPGQLPCAGAVLGVGNAALSTVQPLFQGRWNPSVGSQEWTVNPHTSSPVISQDLPMAMS